MDFDELFDKLKKDADEKRKKHKIDVEKRYKKEHDDIVTLIKTANDAQKNSITVEKHVSQATLDKLKKHCKIEKTVGYNPSTHDDMHTGYKITWEI